MALLDKIREGFLSHIGTAFAASVTALLGWIFYQVVPVILPAMQTGVPSRVVLAILLLSVVLNVVLLFAVWHFSRPKALRLKFGVLWDKDKNPHCPVCKNPGLSYGAYTMGIGYYCNPCKELFSLADASGNQLAPQDVIAQL